MAETHEKKQWADLYDGDQIRAFHEAMLDICRRTFAEVPLLGYTAGTFGVEIREHGGLETAKKCLHSEELGNKVPNESAQKHR